MATAARMRGWPVAAAVVAALAVVARIHNAFAYPPLYDFDAAGHALNVFALYEGRLPSPQSWSGFHPPLYHGLGAALWQLLPTGIPVHVQLRLLSALAGAGAALVVWRALARRAPAADAAVTAAFVLCAPVMAIASGMLGNETTCAFFATLALARLAEIPVDPRRARRHALGTAVLGALAALSKSTGLGVVAVAGLIYAARLRADRRRAAAAAAIAWGVPLLVLAPYYARVVAVSGGSPMAVVSGAALSPEPRAEMIGQPPGERRLRDYFSLPASTFVAPVHRAPGLDRSVPGLLYASLWADGHGQFLPAGVPAVLRAQALLAVAGVLPTALAVLGVVRLARRRDRSTAAPLLFGALLLAAFLRYTWLFPYYSAVKASYLLPALLAGALALAAGLAAAGPRGRALLRAALLAFAVAATAVTWQGWWR